MKLVFISHVYLVSENQKKLNALSKFMEIFLITPNKWNDYILKEIKMNKINVNFKYYDLPIFFCGNELRYYFKSITLKLNKIKPDVIVVDNGISLVYAQTIISKKIFSKKSKIGFFTWVNMDISKGILIRLIKNFCLNNTDFAIFGNEDAMKIHTKTHKFPYIILPQLGVDFEYFQNAKPVELKTQGFVIGYVGRLVKEKGIYTLIDAVKKLDFKTTLIFIGDGAEREKIINYKTNGKTEIILIPPVEHHKIPSYMKLMDVFVLPSITTSYWKEQFGHVLIEAMAAGVPVIGSSSGEIPNVIKNAGLIFEENNSEKLAECIKKIYYDRKLQQELIEKGKNRVLENYTHEAIALKLNEFLKSIL
ncbi:MAG: glycosyltransferase family 4 protein [bacterium]|nr:glycosyltransferase family 4 protein [bacterium]